MPRYSGGIGDGHPGSVRDGISAGLPAVIIGDRLAGGRNAYRAIIDGLILAEGVLQNIGQAILRQNICLGINDNLIGRKVALEGCEFLCNHVFWPGYGQRAIDIGNVIVCGGIRV